MFVQRWVVRMVPLASSCVDNDRPRLCCLRLRSSRGLQVLPDLLLTGARCTKEGCTAPLVGRADCVPCPRRRLVIWRFGPVGRLALPSAAAFGAVGASRRWLALPHPLEDLLHCASCQWLRSDWLLGLLVMLRLGAADLCTHVFTDGNDHLAPSSLLAGGLVAEQWPVPSGPCYACYGCAVCAVRSLWPCTDAGVRVVRQGPVAPSCEAPAPSVLGVPLRPGALMFTQLEVATRPCFLRAVTCCLLIWPSLWGLVLALRC